MGGRYCLFRDTAVIPAKAGIHAAVLSGALPSCVHRAASGRMDPGFRRDDGANLRGTALNGERHAPLA